ncbi:MAG: NRDE family protein [Ectothiorhodospiraceae bacterium]|nr:NRDE family protein [Ectothiorhodospiraceae bacterium]
MCLLAFAVGVHPDYPLIVAANRDEFHERPAEPAAWWKAPRILAGRDLRAGGTWLGVTRAGGLATITNFRDPERHRPRAPSRGGLVVRALVDPQETLETHLTGHGRDYNGFNLLWAREGAVWYYNNQTASGVTRLTPGIYGLSNGVLDTPWPKLLRVREGLRELVRQRGEPVPHVLFELMSDRRQPPEHALPDTGIGAEWERLLATPFIVDRRYGTRSTSVVLHRIDGTATFAERAYRPDGGVVSERVFRFRLTRGWSARTDSRHSVTGAH